MATSRIAGIPISLIVFAAVLGGLFLFLAVPRMLAHTDPVEDQVIHACVDKHGNIVVADPNADGGSKDKGSKDKGSKDKDGCKKKELALDWNAVGQKGDKGDTGDTGPAGSANINGTPNTVIKFGTATTGVDSQITDDGDVVLIGVEPPVHNDHALRVAGAATFAQYGGGEVSISTPAGAPGIVITRSGGTDRFDQGNFGTYYGFGFNQDWLSIGGQNTPSISIRKGGRVGIGTNNPSGALHVSNDSGGLAVTGHGVTIDSGDILSNARIEIRDSQNGPLQIPYIDFSNDGLVDFDGRLILSGDDELSIRGADLQVDESLGVSGSYRDSSNDAGTAGQVLSSTGSGTDWVAPNTGPPGADAPLPIIRTSTIANDNFVRFVGTPIAESQIIDYCGDAGGCRIRVDSTLGSIHLMREATFFYDSTTKQYWSGGGGAPAGINGNSSVTIVPGLNASTSGLTCYFSDWGESTSGGNGDRSLRMAGITQNSTGTPWTCTIRIDD